MVPLSPLTYPPCWPLAKKCKVSPQNEQSQALLSTEWLRRWVEGKNWLVLVLLTLQLWFLSPAYQRQRVPFLVPPVCVISSVRAGASSASFRCPKPSMRLSRCGICTRPTWGPDDIKFPAPTPDLLTQTLQGGAQKSVYPALRWFWGSLSCWFLDVTAAHPTEEVGQALMGTIGLGTNQPGVD